MLMISQAGPAWVHPVRTPSNGSGPINLYAPNAFFYIFASLEIIVKHILIEIWPKHSKNDLIYSNNI